MNINLQGQRAVVTGVTGGIGAATARRLASLGAEVVVSARSEAKLAGALKTQPDGVTGYVMDVSDPEQVEAFFAQVGAFDHLVTPAATSTLVPLREMDFDAARDLVSSKQWGQMYCVHRALPYLRPDGSITLFSGTVTQKPLPGSSVFAAVGAASEAAGRIWAYELAPLRVNTVVPGVVDTPVWAGMMGSDAAEAHLAAIGETLPVRRVGTPDDVAKAVTFLIDNTFVDGVSLVVDGGHRLI